MKIANLFCFFYCIIFSVSQLNAQEQWATRIIEYSSQYSNSVAGARQALGEPNTYPEYGESKVAWAPSRNDGGGEYLVVEFAKADFVEQIAIVETYNPGAIYQIYLVDERGKERKVYENRAIKPVGNNSRIFSHSIEKTTYKVKQLKVVLNTSLVKGLNQVDAIAISNSSVPIKPKINEVSYKGFSGKAENLGYNVNSKYPDFLPIISPDGKELYFVRKFSPDNIGKDNKDDIYIARKSGSKGWGYASNIGPPLNDEHHNFVCAVSPDGNRLLLSGTYTSNIAKGGVSYSVKNKNGAWSMPINMPIEDDHNYSKFACFHVSPDWKFLVMALHRKDSYGDMDLYVSRALPGNKWSKPRNLGPTINTSGMEPSIFLAADGKTIYFSTNGRPGYGDLDMYMSKRLDDSWTNWTEPVNLGASINTSGKDVYYTVPASGDYAYFSSERDSYGASDMFRIPLPKEVRPEPVAFLKATIKQDNNTSIPKKDIAIVVNEDREELYEQTKGYYPVFSKPNESEIETEEEEDDFENIVLKDGNIVSKNEQDQKINDLRKKLQEMKRNESSSTTAMNRLNEPYEKYVPKTYNTDPVVRKEVDFEETTYTNSLDNRLAELRSQKAAIESGNRVYQPQKENRPVVLKEQQTPFTSSHEEYKDRLSELRAQRDDKEFGKTAPKKIKNLDYDADDPAIKYQPKTVDPTNIEESKKEVVAEVPKNETRKEKLARLRGDEEKKALESYEQKLARLRGETYTPKQEEKIVRAEPVRILKDDKLEEENVDVEEELAVVEEPLLEESAGLEANEHLSKEKEAIAEDIEKLKLEQGELTANAEALAKEKAALQSLIDELEKERAKLAEEREKMAAERQAILAERNKQQADIKDLQAEIDQLLNKKGDLNSDIAKAEEQKKSYEELEEEIFLMPLEVGSVIQINNIFFEVNSAFLKNESYSELNKVSAFLKVNSSIKVEIGGHTNGVCSDDICNKLSVDRAKSVMEYLIAQGISDQRLSSNGYGKTQPIASNETLNGRKKNQRVELKIIEIE